MAEKSGCQYSGDALVRQLSIPDDTWLTVLRCMVKYFRATIAPRVATERLAIAFQSRTIHQPLADPVKKYIEYWVRVAPSTLYPPRYRPEATCVVHSGQEMHYGYRLFVVRAKFLEETC